MGTRAITGTVYKPSGAAWAAGVITDRLLEPFETSTEIYPIHVVSITLDANGQIPASTYLAVPDTGTAHHELTMPSGESYEVYLAPGAAVDLVTLIVAPGSSVAQDDLITLLNNNNLFTPTEVNATYVILSTDIYVRATGTFTITLPAATGSDVMYTVKNVGVGTITVDGATSDTIDGAANVTLYPWDRHGFIDAASGAWDLI